MVGNERVVDRTEHIADPYHPVLVITGCWTDLNWHWREGRTLSTPLPHRLPPSASSSPIVSRVRDGGRASCSDIGAVISLLCKRQNLRQRVVATSCVFFRRFFAKNSYSAMDPFVVAVACIYVAAKAEESPVHIKSIVQEAIRSCYELGHTGFPSDNSSLAEMEFYLLEEMEFDLVIHHSYRSLVAIYQAVGVKTSAAASGEQQDADAAMDQFGVIGGLPSAEQVESGLVDDASDPSSLVDFDPQVLQMAWFVLNDTYKTDIPLMHPPYMIALAALWLALVLHTPSHRRISSSLAQMHDRRAVYQSHIAALLKAENAPPPNGLPTSPDPPSQDTLTFFATLNVSLPLLAEIIQDIISSYHLQATAASLVNDAPAMVKLLADMREKRRQDLLQSSPTIDRHT